MMRNKLFYITTIALIVSNVTTLVLAFLFAQALRSNIEKIAVPMPAYGLTSFEAQYGDGGGSGSVPDTTPPTISGIAVYNLTTVSAFIRWTTNEPANGTVRYGRASGNYPYTATANSVASATVPYYEHVAFFGNLATSTKWYYRVNSTDTSGNTATSNERSFTTPATYTAAGAGGGGCYNNSSCSNSCNDPLSPASSGAECEAWRRNQTIQQR